MGFAAGSQLPRGTPTTPASMDDGFNLLPPILVVLTILVVVGGLAIAHRFRNDGGWMVTPVSAVGFPLAAILTGFAAVQLFMDPPDLVASALFPLLPVTAVYGAAVVLGAAIPSGQRRYGLVALAIIGGAVAVPVATGSWPIKGAVVLAGPFGVVGFFIGYLTS